MKHSFLLIIFLVIIFPSSAVTAAPWINVGDTGLRADIQLLADSGKLNIPVASYPLMWASVASVFDQIEFKNLNQAQQNAYFRIKQAMRKATQKGNQVKLNLFSSSQSHRFSGFEANHYEKNKFTVSSENITSSFSYKLAVNIRGGFHQLPGDTKVNFDNSYFAYKIGNWIIDAGSLDQWWGPGMETSLIMSNNARPLPAVAIRRNSSEPFDTPWLSWIGPWTFSAQMADLGPDRYVPNAQMWSSRATFKPYKKLELGLAWSYQWAGQGQPNSIGQFVRGLLGQTECVNGASTCDESLQSKLGNQLAGFDARWADTIGDYPYAVYAQTIGEDSPSPGTIRISDKSYLYGIETQLPFVQSLLINLEYSDTQANCGPRGDTSQDCFYEHGLYRSGYRYYQRSIGSNYDNDAQTLVLTLFSQLENGDQWQLKLRDLSLNTNDRDRYPNNPLLGNGVSKVAEKVKQIDLNYRFMNEHYSIKLGSVYSQSDIQQTSTSEFDLYVKYQYLF